MGLFRIFRFYMLWHLEAGTQGKLLRQLGWNVSHLLGGGENLAQAALAQLPRLLTLHFWKLAWLWVPACCNNYLSQDLVDPGWFFFFFIKSCITRC